MSGLTKAMDRWDYFAYRYRITALIRKKDRWEFIGFPFDTDYEPETSSAKTVAEVIEQAAQRAEAE